MRFFCKKQLPIWLVQIFPFFPTQKWHYWAQGPFSPTFECLQNSLSLFKIYWFKPDRQEPDHYWSQLVHTRSSQHLKRLFTRINSVNSVNSVKSLSSVQRGATSAGNLLEFWCRASTEYHVACTQSIFDYNFFFIFIVEQDTTDARVNLKISTWWLAIPTVRNSNLSNLWYIGEIDPPPRGAPSIISTEKSEVQVSLLLILPVEPYF